MQNLKPRKYLGQHFLTDQQVAARIVSCLQAEPTDAVIEIGPGEGVLTEFLAQKFPNLRLLEVDERAIEVLKHRFLDRPVQVIEADVLKWPMETELTTEVAFIGNLPYNISSPIFFRMLEHRDRVKEGVFMIQKEVAERICADKGNKTYGILSVLLGAYFDLSYEFSVPPTVFRPPPKVMSGVLRMARKEEQPEIPFPTLKRVVKQAFGQRRKTLRNALKGLEFRPFPEQEHIWTQRAEQLSVADFLHLSAHLVS